MYNFTWQPDQTTRACNCAIVKGYIASCSSHNRTYLIFTQTYSDRILFLRDEYEAENAFRMNF